MERGLLVSAERLTVQWVQAKQRQSSARDTALNSTQSSRQLRFALLSLCVLISLFQLMFAGCALQEVRGAGAQMTSFALISTALQWQVVINGDLWPG